MGVLDWFKNRSFQFDSDSEAEERAFLGSVDIRALHQMPFSF